MRLSKLLVLSLVWLIFWGVSSFADQKDQSEYKKIDTTPIMKEPKVDKGISSGNVFAFGEKLSPPYYVTYESGKVLVNGIVFYPRDKDPKLREAKIVVTDTDIQKHNLIKDCEASYVKNYKLYGSERAKELLLEEFKKNPLITNLEFKDELLKIEFADGDYENIFLSSFITASETPPLTQAQKDEQMKEKVDNITSFLKNGYMIAFGYDYTVYIPQKRAKEIIGAIDRIRKGEVDRSVGENEITRISRKTRFAKDIIKHIQDIEPGR